MFGTKAHRFSTESLPPRRRSTAGGKWAAGAIEGILVSQGFVEIRPGEWAKTSARPEFRIADLRPQKAKDLKILERRFLELFAQAGGDPATLEPEYRFHPTRRWRVDFFHAGSRSLIEIEGGLYGFGGRHNKAEGYTRDAEKYNAAEAMGYRLFRLTSKLLTIEYVNQVVAWLAAPFPTA